MNRFGVCYVPPEDKQKEYVTGRQWATHPTFDDSNRLPPAVLYFRSEEERDAGMKELIKSFPGQMFAGFEITSAAATIIGPAAFYSVSEKGVLPK